MNKDKQIAEIATVLTNNFHIIADDLVEIKFIVQMISAGVKILRERLDYLISCKLTDSGGLVPYLLVPIDFHKHLTDEQLFQVTNLDAPIFIFEVLTGEEAKELVMSN